MGGAKCTGFFTSAAAGRFVKLLAASQAARDIRIATLRFDGRLASYLFCFDTPRELQMYFTATDRSLTLYRPGVVLTWLVLRHSMDRGKTSYNFLLGDEEYKRRWRAAPLRQQSIRIYGRSPIAAAMMSGRICLRWVKRRAQDLVSSRSTA